MTVSPSVSLDGAGGTAKRHRATRSAVPLLRLWSGGRLPRPSWRELAWTALRLQPVTPGRHARAVPRVVTS